MVNQSFGFSTYLVGVEGLETATGGWSISAALCCRAFAFACFQSTQPLTSALVTYPLAPICDWSSTWRDVEFLQRCLRVLPARHSRQHETSRWINKMDPGRWEQLAPPGAYRSALRVSCANATLVLSSFSTLCTWRCLGCILYNPKNKIQPRVQNNNLGCMYLPPGMCICPLGCIPCPLGCIPCPLGCICCPPGCMYTCPSICWDVYTCIYAAAYDACPHGMV